VAGHGIPTLRTILCPVDFSDQSQEALRWAIALAAQHQSRLTVLTAVDPLLAHAAKARLNVDLPSTETEPALRELVNAAMPAGASWAPETAIDVRVGEASEVILEAADRERAELIVLGTQGLGGIRKLILGSTTERVLRATRTPLLAVPAGGGHVVVLDPGGPRWNMETILIATDFSKAAADAVQWAADLAKELSVRLVFAHVVTQAELAPPSDSDGAQGDDEQAAEARKRLEELAARIPGSLERDTVVTVGQPADSIASIAKERHAGLIVVGLTGQGGLLAPKPGSIAYRVMSLAHVPVLVVPPHTSS
jgi:nucleotide-binding universal stress UspA family protein